MTKEEYIKKRNELIEEQKKAIKKIDREFAYSNNHHNVGDIIEDHIGKGRIVALKWGYEWDSSEPCMVYECENLTRKGTLNKKEPTRQIWQSNLKE